MSRLDKLCGVILAAGKQVHLAPLDDAGPRPLLPIGNAPAIQHHLAAMAAIGIRRVLISVGEHLDLYRASLAPPAGLEVEYAIRDTDLGIAHALFQLGPLIDGPFLLALGDVFALPSEYGALLPPFAAGEADAVIAVRDEPDPALVARNFAVVVDADERVRRVHEKAEHTGSRLKGIGIYLFDEGFFDALRRTPRTAVRDRYELTDAIQIYVDEGHAVRVCAQFDWDVNLTEPRDLLAANMAYLAHHGLTRIVAPDVAVPDGVTLERVVIGAGATVGPGAQLRDAVVLPGARVPAGAVVERALVTRHGTMPFG